MKCLACRSALPGYPGDIEDIRFLLQKMNIHSMAEVDAHVEHFYPYEALTPEARRIIETLLPKPPDTP